mgnify:CR=1 FL=1
MKCSIERKVYFADTDAYGVVWHGTYLRWFEMGRIEFCSELGMNLATLAQQNVVFPVAGINIKYKTPAKLNDEIIIETSVEKLTPLSCTFKQIVKNKSTEIINATAEVEVVAVNNEGKLYRRFPQEIKEKFDKVITVKG